MLNPPEEPLPANSDASSRTLSCYFFNLARSLSKTPND